MLTNQLLFGTVIITSTVVFHVVSLVLLANVLRYLNKTRNLFESNSGLLFCIILTVLTIIGIHTIEAWTWAAIYYFLGEFSEFSQALYFSVVTSTTLGYGDIILSERWQILGTFESMGGLILFGTSTAFLLGLLEKLIFKDKRD